MGVAGVLEVVGSSLVALGLFTRPAAFILSGEMAVPYFMAHAPHGFFPLLNPGRGCRVLLLRFPISGSGWRGRLEPRQASAIEGDERHPEGGYGPIDEPFTVPPLGPQHPQHRGIRGLLSRHMVRNLLH
jgi:hypothetical protein